MARNYSFKDANNIIKQFNRLLNDLNTSDKYIKQYEKEIKNNAEFLLRSGVFKRIILQDLNEQIPKKINYSDTYELIKAMYCYFQSMKLSNYCVELYKNNNELIESYKNSLSRGNNPIKRLFLNNSEKQECEEAFIELQNELKGSFFTNSASTLDKLKGLRDVFTNTVYEDIFKNEQEYQNILFKIYPTITEVDEKINKIEDLILEKNQINDNFQRIQANFYNSKTEIKNAIDKLIARELLKLLKGIPISELNREKNGIRVKPLTDYGYQNIADIYTSSASQLASIQGISYTAANTIKKIAERYAKETYKTTKIKLNTDDKNVDSNRAICLLYQYKIRKKLITEKDRLTQLYKEEIDNKVQQIKKIRNGVKYYFSTYNEKIQYLDNYKWLNNTIFGEDFGLKAKKIIREYTYIKEAETSEAWNDFSINSIEFYNIIEEIYPGVLGNDDSFYGLPEKLAREIQDECFFPEGLLCTLRQYQEWGVKYILHQEKVLLGDEMGLGKTIQAIATMVSLKNTGATHFIVVCPASVVTNWCREISRHSRLKVTMIYGINRNIALKSWIDTGGVAVTTYETTQHIILKPSYKYSLLVVDEAHYIKNPFALRSENTEKLCNHAERMLFMTGTAIENNVEEMINLIRILRPSIANEVKNIAFMSSAPQFREKIAPVYYRRKRNDVLTELPDLIESKEWCTMNKSEELVYESTILSGTYPAARRLSWNIDDLKNSSKAQRLKELVNEAESEGRKIIVFSFFLDTIRKISDFLGKRCSTPITGAIDSEKRQEIIDEFDKAKAGSVLLAQILAGGTGLNIQSASVVIICEPQFKPSIENQAISRAYRMGQSRNVLVYRLLCQNTIDEKISNLLEKKQKIFDEFADKSVAAEKSIEVDERAFDNIIREEIERIKIKNELNSK